MKRIRSFQQVIHWLEVGEGSRWMVLAATICGLLLVTVVLSHKRFAGPADETVYLRVGMARELAEGRGFASPVVYPQARAVLEARGRLPAAGQPMPDLYEAPFYPLLLAGGFALLPESLWARLFERPPVPPGGFGGDYLVLAFNLFLHAAAAAQIWWLGRRLFSSRVAWSSLFGYYLLAGFWERAWGGGGDLVLVNLVLAQFHVMAGMRDESGSPAGGRRRWLLAGLLGMIGGFCLLTRYSALPAAFLGLAGLCWVYRAKRGALAAVWLGALAVVVTPWIVRNVYWSGSPIGLAWENVTLRAGDPTAEPADRRARAEAAALEVNIRKAMNKGFSAWESGLRERWWTGGGVFAAFFVASVLYRYRRRENDRLRWLAGGLALASLLLPPFFQSDPDMAADLIAAAAPALVFGAAFIGVLAESRFTAGWQVNAVFAGVLIFQGIGIVQDALEPRRIHFQYPPYYPPMLMQLGRDSDRGAPADSPVMADLPAGSAWYAGREIWAVPARMEDFLKIHVERPVSALILTSHTLNRPYFSDLVRGREDRPVPASLGFRGWEDVYRGLATGRLPAGFPLSRPIRVADNLIVLTP